jgi:hypothetical protein
MNSFSSYIFKGCGVVFFAQSYVFIIAADLHNSSGTQSNSIPFQDAVPPTTAQLAGSTSVPGTPLSGTRYRSRHFYSLHHPTHSNFYILK